MLTVLIIISFILCVLTSFIIYRLNQLQNNNKPNADILKIVEMMQGSSKDDRKILLESLQRNSEMLNQRLDNAARVISDVQRNVGEMSEIGRGMKDLQEFLKSPKLRGNIGEHILNELLSQMLPKQSFHLQYAFASGERVDAAIKTSAGIIPIDSKFPMENFRKMLGAGTDAEKLSYARDFERDVKKHVDAISKKYILTHEGTIDYALMYIPSEAVYYEIVNNAALFDYAGEARVLPVSPTTFYAYLKAILMSFEGQKLEGEAKRILASLRSIQKEYTKVGENIGTLQKHITNASNMMTTVVGRFGSLGQRISSTREIGEETKKELEG